MSNKITFEGPWVTPQDKAVPSQKTRNRIERVEKTLLFGCGVLGPSFFPSGVPILPLRFRQPTRRGKSAQAAEYRKGASEISSSWWVFSRFTKQWNPWKRQALTDGWASEKCELASAPASDRPTTFHLPPRKFPCAAIFRRSCQPAGVEAVLADIAQQGADTLVCLVRGMGQVLEVLSAVRSVTAFCLG